MKCFPRDLIDVQIRTVLCGVCQIATCQVCGNLVPWNARELHEQWHCAIGSQLETLANTPEVDLSYRAL